MKFNQVVVAAAVVLSGCGNEGVQPKVEAAAPEQPPETEVCEGSDEVPADLALGTKALGTLGVSWQYEAPANRRLAFPGLMDGDRNLYWFECNDCRCGDAAICQPDELVTTADADAEMGLVPQGSVTCELVSATAEGSIRYRQRIALDETPTGMIAGNTLFLSGSRSIAAHDIRDGRELWNAKLTSGSYDHVAALVAASERALVYSGSGNLPGSWLQAIPTSPLVDDWTVEDDARAFMFGGVMDAAANFFYRGRDGFVGRDGSGRVVWQHSTRWPAEPLREPIAAYDGQLVLADGLILSVNDGRTLGQPAARDIDAAAILEEQIIEISSGLTDRHLGAPGFRQGTSKAPWSVAVTWYDRASGMRVGAAEVGLLPPGDGWTTAATATSDGGLLFGAGTSGVPADACHDDRPAAAFLILARADGGASVWELPAADRYAGAAVLDGSRWIAATARTTLPGTLCELHERIVAFNLPESIAPANSGWIGFGANPQRNRRAIAP